MPQRNIAWMILIPILLWGTVHGQASMAMADQVTDGDEVEMIHEAPLKSGRTTLAIVKQGTLLTVRKVQDDYALVTLNQDSTAVAGWIHVRHLKVLVAPPVSGHSDAEPAHPGATPTTKPNTQTPEPTTFSLGEIQELRQKAQRASEISMEMLDNIPEGWSISKFDLMKLFGVFEALKLKPGYVLRAYQFRSGGNGNAAVWAMPVDATFPDPNELTGGTFQLFKAPKPGKSLDNYMEVVDGDRTARSFLSASLLSRELREFGSLWHGCDWMTHTIFADDPWNETAHPAPNWMTEPPSRPESKWTWHVDRPTDWRPRLVVAGDVVKVIFYTYSPMDKEAIYRHVDEFRPGEYRFTTERTKIATGTIGLAF